MGKEVNELLYGYDARCFLHELDHLNGITYDMHVTPMELQKAKEILEKVVKTKQNFGEELEEEVNSRIENRRNSINNLEIKVNKIKIAQETARCKEEEEAAKITITT